MVDNIDEKIYAYALDNAYNHGGRAQDGAVLSHLFKDGLQKEEIKEVMPKIKEIIKKVNSLKKEELDEAFSNYKKDFEKLKEINKQNTRQEGELPELPGAIKGKVVTRLPPEPSKYNHLGHALSFLLNYLYAQKYEGKCILRFEDTNPEKVSKEFIKSMKEDIEGYLDIKVDETRYVSDDMEMLYKMALQLINQEKAFMCFCDREALQNNRHQGLACVCRANSKEKNLQEWEKFKKGKYKEGEATLRIRGDMKALNHTMRDSVIFRYLKASHYKYKKKYKVWPMYDFYNPIEDSSMGVTHILRSNEFEQREELHDYIRGLLGLSKQTMVQYGRFNVEGSTTKGREIREMIESGEYLGWDDPRLMTLRALKRRGITKEAIYELAKKVGLSRYQVNFQFEMIAALNRKIIDPIANRYFFVELPKKIVIEKFPGSMNNIELAIHPDKTTLRKIKAGPIIYVANKDFEENKDKQVRLMSLFNIKMQEKTVMSEDHTRSIQKIQWVSEKFKTKARIMMPDAKWAEGLAEKNIEKLKVGEMIQFERVGFCRFDKKKGKTYEFWYAHK
ncbi:MAG: glutamate--tRNA ligase [Nanoarchaeota archaeon]